MRTLPKGPERLYCEIGMLACWVPVFWKILENVQTEFKKLKKALRNGFNLNIVGYDGYHVDKSLWECYNDVSRPFGHELVLYTLLTIENPEDYPWNRFYRENEEIYRDRNLT